MLRRRLYKFTNKKHAKYGVLSSITGVSALAVLVGLLYWSYLKAGNGGPFLGLFGMISMIASLCGLVMAIKGFYEEDKFYIFSRIGCVLNGLLFIGWMLIFIMGM